MASPYDDDQLDQYRPYSSQPLVTSMAGPSWDSQGYADSRGRVLRKPMPSHARSASAQQVPSQPDYSLPTLQQLQQGDLFNPGPGLPGPLQPPPTLGDSYTYSRSSSQDSRSRQSSFATNSRPITPTIHLVPEMSTQPASPGGKKEKKEQRKGAVLTKYRKESGEEARPIAWIAGHPKRPAYDVVPLMNGRPIPELWDDDNGNCLVHLFPRSANKGPSFKIDSAIIASSPILTRMAFGDVHNPPGAKSGGDRRQSSLEVRAQGLSLYDPPNVPASPRSRHVPMDSRSSASSGSRGRLSNLSDPSAETHLYLSIQFRSPQTLAPMATTPRQSDNPSDPAMQDLQMLIDMRNLFAFLTGQALIGTEKTPTLFNIFIIMAAILRSYEFSNLDGSTFGEVASSSFDNYIEELGLADVRTSREKTIEGVVLGEKLKSVALYNEAFTHAAGKLEALANLKSPKFGLLSSVTDNRLIRAALDLSKRVQSVELILTDFDFPALFTGIMASKTSEERKEGVRFDGWKDGFLGFRKNYLGMLKNRYGDWPPKAKSKKNDLETSGLNRLVLRDLYHDMSAVYDLLVDRTSLTSRTVDGVNLAGPREEPTVRAIRAVLSEYDRSSPPVKPPVPFDLPIMPKITSARPNFGQDEKKDAKALSKKLRDDDISSILLQSWNKDVLAKPSPFLQAFWEMEKRAAHGCTIAELEDLRIGQWIFVYVILQALPMLACDAPGLKWTRGVEYFLCEPPRKGVPWANPHTSTTSLQQQQTPTPSATPGAGRTWFAIDGGLNVVSLPSDVVEHGVEGIYRRSHCWTMAEKWTANDAIMHEALHEHEALNDAAELARNPRRVSRYDPGSGTSTPELAWPSTPPLASNFGGNNGLLAAPDSRPSSRAKNRNSSLNLGLEALPLPVGVNPDVAMMGFPPTLYQQQQQNQNRNASGTSSRATSGERPRSVQHAPDAKKTFDAILADVGTQGKRGKKK